MNSGQRVLRLLLAWVPWLGFILLVLPGPWQRVFFTPGHFLAWTGLPCPLCGGTRAMRALLLGDWSRALYLNPLAVLVVLGGLLWTAACLWEAWRGRALVPGWDQKLAPAGRWLVLLIVLYWIYHAGTAWWWPKEELLNRGGFLLRR
ncbi:MAG: DUF2752 domain-containing protein [Candidatus Methylacidiphilales bacterium]|nr:DUF2752 domain-containing protein [Candidatus Methylacidiphilales bacterium]